jgi:hypothetical protein
MTRIFFLILQFVSTLSLYVIRPSQPIKYIQGLHFNQGHLYYGTNNGYVISVTRQDDTVITKWHNKLSNRNIRSINSFNKQLVINCDATHPDETSRTFICSKDGDVMDSTSWEDTTIVEGIYESMWVRCNTKGYVSSKTIMDENIFPIRLEIPLCENDYLTCGVVQKNMLYTMSLNGFFTIIDLRTFTIVWEQHTQYRLSTCINVHEPFGHDTKFIYIGNQKGEVYFLQFKENENKKISSTVKKLYDNIVTNIYIHPTGPIFYFKDATIKGFQFVSFDSFLDMKLDDNYSFQNTFTISNHGLFSIKNKNEIQLYRI